MIKKTITAAAVTFVALGAVAFAHSGASGIYKERMDAMAAMGKVVKDLSAIMRGEADYDAAKIQEGARLIQSHAGEAMTLQFPEGTTDKPSEARVEIWSDWDTFSELAKQLQINAEGLESFTATSLLMPLANLIGILRSEVGFGRTMRTIKSSTVTNTTAMVPYFKSPSMTSRIVRTVSLSESPNNLQLIQSMIHASML